MVEHCPRDVFKTVNNNIQTKVIIAMQKLSTVSHVYIAFVTILSVVITGAIIVDNINRHLCVKVKGKIMAVNCVNDGIFLSEHCNLIVSYNKTDNNKSRNYTSINVMQSVNNAPLYAYMSGSNIVLYYHVFNRDVYVYYEPVDLIMILSMVLSSIVIFLPHI